MSGGAITGPETAVEAGAGVHPELQFRLLGPLQIRHGDRQLTLERRQERALLAALLLDHGRVVPVERLGDLLWDGDPPPRYRSSLHTQVSRVRGTLRTAGAGPWLRSAHGGYVIDLPTGALDVDRFRDLAERARLCGDPAERAALLRSACGLWRGPVLCDVGTPRLRFRLGAELDELRLVALEELAASLIEAGHPELALAELVRLAAEYPSRERMVELLMLALARTGRQAEALQAYEEYRLRLAEEAGIDPGAQLSAVRLDILRATHAAMARYPRGVAVGAEESGAALSVDEPGAVPRSAGAAAGEPGAAPVPFQLPSDVRDFTGRGAEIDRVVAVLADRRSSDPVSIAAVCGPAGVGKTTLAVHIGHRLRPGYPDGQLYVNLMGAHDQPADPAEVLAQFLRALGVPGGAVPQTLDERAATYRSLLSDRRVLVLLDNAADEGQIRNLIPGTGAAGVLITSRRRLTGLPGAKVFSLDVLGENYALSLLAAIVGAERVDGEPDAASELVRLCAGLPLAIRIVGARLAARPYWSLRQLVDRLLDEHGRLDELAHADLGVRASLSLSYRGLVEADRSLLRRLALLETPDLPGWVAAAVADPATGRRPTAADQVAADQVADRQQAAAGLDRLVQAHLLDVVCTDRAGQVRFRFHDLVRLYARERCLVEESAADRSALLERALGGWLALGRLAHRTYRGEDYPARACTLGWEPDEATAALVERDPVGWFIAEQRSLLAGVRQAELAGLDAICWQLAAAGSMAFLLENCIDEDWLLHESGRRAATRAGDQAGLATMLVGLAVAAAERFQVERAKQLAVEASSRFAGVGDRHGRAYAENILACIQRQFGEPEAALERYRGIVEVFAEYGDQAGVVTTLRDMGRLYLDLDSPARALEALRRARSIASQLGHRFLVASTAFSLGEACLDLGYHREAERELGLALAECRDRAERAGQSLIMHALGVVALRTGRHDHAGELLCEAVSLARTVNERMAELRALRGLGDLSMATGDPATAVSRYRESLAIASDIGNHRLVEVLEDLLALAERAAQGRDAEAGAAQRPGD